MSEADTTEAFGPEDEAEILDSIDAWVAREVRPIAREHDLADEYPAGLVEQMKELGLFGATIDPEEGHRIVAGYTLAWARRYLMADDTVQPVLDGDLSLSSEVELSR